MNEKLKIAPHVVEAVVNHMSGLAKAGVAGVYNRALYFDDAGVRSFCGQAGCVISIEVDSAYASAN